ncbi:unnamed protein product [Lymnaea stagnalis]|uniref:Major facilitator superfamily (MFS) profile domain-containing protein n=1 Tax=Lymnaea stagnalis TaxID=6523 RepID=A0AAV2ILZ1_LYMST
MAVDQRTMKATPLWNSARLSMAIFAFLGFLNFYSLRVNMSIAIVCMVNHTAIRHHDATNNTTNAIHQRGTAASCELNADPWNSSLASYSDEEDGELIWDKEGQGLIHSSLFWGYILTNLPGGILATRYSGKHVMGLSLLAAALLTLLVPVVARANIQGLMVLRFITGASQGFVSPAMQSLWTHWAPPLESSRLRSIGFAGSQLGKVITYPLTALLCQYGFDGGWPSIFYLQGLFGIVWYIAWTYAVYDSPAQHPRISGTERHYIESSLSGMVTTNKRLKTPWLAILKSMPVWAIFVAHTCCNWGEYTFLTNIPTYLKEVLHFDIKENGFLSAVPYIGFWLVITLSSFLADFVRSKNILSTTATRKVFNSIGKFVPAVLLIGLSFVGCSQWGLAVTLLTLGVSLTGFQYGGGLFTNVGDIAPSYGGVIYGVSNTIATIPGLLSPVAIALLTPDQTQEQWRGVFYLSAAIYVFGAVFYIVFSSGSLQPWAVDAAELHVSAREEELEEKVQLNETITNDRETMGQTECPRERRTVEC